MSFHRARYVPLGTPPSTTAPPRPKEEEDDAIAMFADWAATKAVDAAAAILKPDDGEDEEEGGGEDNTAVWAMTAAGVVFALAMLAILSVAALGLVRQAWTAAKYGNAL